MPLSSGNSGASLVESVTKFHSNASIEGAFCEHLGDGVCPMVYGIGPGYYTMERLTDAERSPGLLKEIEDKLEMRVWSRPMQNYDSTANFIEFQKSMGIETPDWAIPKEFCLIHGDPTVSNAMRRDNGDLILIDPRAPNGHIPSWKTVDMGKILQSYFGWESAAYGEKPVRYERPRFMYDPELCKQAMFWLEHHVRRIEQYETERGLNRLNIRAWCNSILED